MRNYVFPITIGLTALLMAAMAAFFSITGMGKIFIGWPILVMTSAIELGKLVAVSILYRLWSRLGLWKYLLVPMTAIIMLLTSAGIYGYLSSAYEQTASGMRTQDSKVQLEDKKKESLSERIVFYEKAIERKQQRASTLSDLRTQQENRMDSLYSKNQVRAAKNVQSSIEQADREITKLGYETDSLSREIGNIRTEMTSIDSLVISMEAETAGGETGALKYVARTTGMSMDSVANLFMLMIIFVFDPLAIILVVVFNIAWDRAEENAKNEAVSGPEGKKNVVVYSANDDGEFIQTKSEVRPQEELKTDVLSQQSPKEQEVIDEKKEIRSDDKVLQKPLMTDKKELYPALLYILYQDGKLNENDNLDTYDQFIKRVSESNISCTEKQIDDFLKVCVLRGIVKVGKQQRVALKKYADAVEAMKPEIAS